MPADPQDLPLFDSWQELIAAYDASEPIRDYVQHNSRYWRWIHGARKMLRGTRFSFDPVPEYWQLTERRLLVAYFTTRLKECYAPADALRRLAWKAFRHFERAREDGRLGSPVVASPASWGLLRSRMVEVAQELPDWEEFRSLSSVWPRLRQETFKDDLLAFLEKAAEYEIPDPLEGSFYYRIAWFPYLGLVALEDLRERQRFFFAFYELFASTNAYVVGGALAFAPVLQNNPTDLLLQHVERWAAGEAPDQTRFIVAGKSDHADRSHLAPVAELYGFLNLQRQPFYNNKTFSFYELLPGASELGRFELMSRVGASSRRFVETHPSAEADLAARLREILSEELPTALRMEGIALESVKRKLPEEVPQQVETILYPEIRDAASRVIESLGSTDLACAMLHLMLDSALYVRTVAPPPPPKPDATPEKVEMVTPPADLSLELPVSLTPIANDALGYLRSGHHVLFAGPPGTGKTSLAQIVGFAWNRELDSVPSSIPLADAPTTTVANSSWAPFHTIGGIVPDENGGFRLERGIFIAEDETSTGEWRLRDECLVLDEMNRADLDRCIGELYPLLSRSVALVRPAGIPGVRGIRTSIRFRVLATVNDTTIDDIVFPISEGLARRFVRIELHGALEEELESYVLDPAREERRDAARSVLGDLFEVLREMPGQLTTTPLCEHLPFGVGYFSLLRSWAMGELRLSPEFEDLDHRDRASRLVLAGLRSAARFRGLKDVIRKFEDRTQGAG